MKLRKNVGHLSKIFTFIVFIIVVNSLFASNLKPTEILFTHKPSQSYVLLYYFELSSKIHYLPIPTTIDGAWIFKNNNWESLQKSFNRFNPLNLSTAQKKKIQKRLGIKVDGKWGKGTWKSLAIALKNNKDSLQFNISNSKTENIIFKKHDLNYGVNLPSLPSNEAKISQFFDSLKVLFEQSRQIGNLLSKLKSLRIPANKKSISFSPELRMLKKFGFKINTDDDEILKIEDSQIIVSDELKRSIKLTPEISLIRGDFKKEIQIEILPIPKKSNYLPIIAFTIAFILFIAVGFLFLNKIRKQINFHEREMKRFLEENFTSLNISINDNKGINDAIDLITNLNNKLNDLLKEANIQNNMISNRLPNSKNNYYVQNTFIYQNELNTHIRNIETQRLINFPFNGAVKNELNDKLNKIEKYIENNNNENKILFNKLKNFIEYLENNILKNKEYEQLQGDELLKKVIKENLLDNLKEDIYKEFKNREQKIKELKIIHSNFTKDVGKIFSSIRTHHDKLNEFLDYDQFREKFPSKEESKKQIDEISNFISDLEIAIPVNFKIAEELYNKIQKWVNTFLVPRKTAGESVVEKEIDELSSKVENSILGTKSDRPNWLKEFAFFIDDNNSNNAIDRFWNYNKNNKLHDITQLTLKVLFKLDIALVNFDKGDNDYKQLYELRLGFKALVYQLQAISLQFGRIYHEIIPNDFVNLDFMNPVGDLNLLVNISFSRFAKKYPWEINRIKEVKYWGYSTPILTELGEEKEELALQTGDSMKSVVVINRKN